jgi:hypothetical protein
MTIVNKNLLIALGLALSFSVGANIVDRTKSVTVNQSDIDSQNKLSSAKSTRSSVDNLEDWQDAFLADFDLDDWGEKNGKVFVSSIQAVMVKNTDPQYGDALASALDAGMLQLQTNSAMIRYGRLINEVVGNKSIDRSTNANQLDLPSEKNSEKSLLNKMLSLFDKKLDVADKKADIELGELGAGVDEVEKRPEMIQKSVSNISTVKKTIKRAMGSVSGLTLIKTAVNTDASGQTSIGLIGVVSLKTRQVARDIKNGRKSIVTGKGDDVYNFLPKNNEDFLGTLGTRFLYDADGSPVIISYGIGSYVADSGDSFMNEEYRKEAKDNARSNAEAQISDFVSGRISAKQERVNGQMIDNLVEREDAIGSATMPKKIKGIIKKVFSKSTLKSNIDSRALIPIKRWSYTTKDGHKFVGVVVAYKYKTLKAINNLNSGSYKKPESDKSKAKNKYKHSSEEVMIDSRTVNTLDDF